MFSADADIFFMPPRVGRTTANPFSTLYLLRRDIDTCMGKDPDNGQVIEHRALWPGAMAIFAGIDLLAKFYAGDDKGSEVTGRFLSFVEHFFPSLNVGDKDVLYQLRNALLHSFGLYSKTKHRVYRFFLTANGTGALVRPVDPDYYFVDLVLLERGFDEVVEAYRTALEATPALQAKFAAIFANYGQVYLS